MNKSRTSKTLTASVPQNVMGRVKTSYPRLRRILVPLDFSGKSRQALRYAAPIAQKFSAKIVLLHVIQPVYGASAQAAGFLPIPNSMSRSALYRLEEMAITLIPAAQRGPNVVTIGTPAEEILAAAKKHDVDMIVLTTHGRTGLKHFFIGSTAEQIMRHATCPVLSVRRQ